MRGDKEGRRYYYLLPQLLKHPNFDNRRAVQQVHSQLITNASHSAEMPMTIWNNILRHYSLSSFPEEAIFLYKHLQFHQPHWPILFDSFTYSFLVKACANLQRTIMGVQFHGLTLKAGFEFHVYVQTALVNMYVVCGSVFEAKKVFDEMPERNSVTWNALITGLMKCEELELSRSLFEVMPTKNVVSWTGLIDGYARMNRPKEAMLLFRRMVVDEGIKPTEITILAILPALWNLRALELCQSVHAYGERSGFNASDIRIMNCLIDAYAKCGCVESALRLFEDVSAERRNLVSWTSIISGLAMHGMAKEAVDNFRRMENARVMPNSVTFLSVLNACSHGGLVEEGLSIFRKMVNECQLIPNIKHYGCLIDMLGRAGRFEEAEKMALEIPPEMANVVIWRTLLGACSFHGNVEMGERVTRKILEMERGYGGDYVLLSNIFAGVGRFADSERTRGVMDERNAPKVPGLSLV
ncbi:pentatricopeptide repeat-containing protein At1g09220, mitochondrial-like [Cornus florida]|uniref:pentatricopeptide repeat-containing protein At1g09220, mitochondrial-like n=1 Tax=Cornus florida TaxID=4283 RepID=UPI0028995078|nr:pentatricopeptide repeat-containing protein At1g09220, mitochondrial-like [Cornus florida]XP_059656753.1 pentatricopeptide repeat-containing protein At1g09220, mitochondrial-like [Cornus florida]